MTRLTDDELQDLLAVYREALENKVDDLGVDAARETVITAAREQVAADDEQLYEQLIAFSDSDFGEPVWNLEEEILDDRLDPDFNKHHRQETDESVF